MQQKIFITLRITPKGKHLESWELTDASSLTDAEKIALFDEFMAQFKCK